jgi:hypothetical protein
MRCPGYRWRDSGPGSGTELENLSDGAKGKGTSGGPVRPKVPIRQTGADCPVVAMKRLTTVEQRGRVIRAVIDWSTGNGRNRLVMAEGGSPRLDGTSRVMGDHQARICESLEAKFRGATRHSRNAGWSYTQPRHVSSTAKTTTGLGSTNTFSSTFSGTPSNLDGQRIAGGSSLSAFSPRSAPKQLRRSARPSGDGGWPPHGTINSLTILRDSSTRSFVAG